MKLDGKVALVTGSTTGIGQAIALRLAADGARIVIDHRADPEGAAETLAKVEAAGGKCFQYGCNGAGKIVQADVSEVEQVRRMVAESVAHFGRLDILVNNAGIQKKASFWEVTEEDYDQVMDVNLKGAFFSAQAFVHHCMNAQHPGKIINISSVHEELSFPDFASYCASKGGMKMMTRTLATELAPLGITINNVAPGAIATDKNTSLQDDSDESKEFLKKIPLQRMGNPEEVASLVSFLCSAEADYITGSTFLVDGGLMWTYQEP
ncbi:SDR family NAD(P)-dependent oxidoreductase [Leptolyngbya sp. O-77]|uniref:SDR family NAD(P)-dependent oxidoreductase n=1 Tax=Leptolyngbya sp. O-77 TaxID=1080068 RepID=UPI00074D4C0F|nr:glucose 1-dehydrogenase [Leptolyngbya sp. O-77]BAU43033.1 Glucose 1-dehydrogenase 2 [Leptolyngbya sp. O-77]